MQPLGSLPTKIWYSAYLLYDEFTTALSAGSVNGTSAEPVGGVRTVTDTNVKISITGGVANFATGAAANSGIWYPVQQRVVGKALLIDFNVLSASGRVYFGWDTNQAGSVVEGFDTGPTALLRILSNATAIEVGAAISYATWYQTVTVLRSTGTWFFIKGGAYSKWTLNYISPLTSANMYPVVSTVTTTPLSAYDNVRVPKSLYIPVPLQSDGFSAGTTDGLGNPENNGPVGNSYSDVGTWGVTGGKRACSALSGGLGFSYLACSSTDVLIDATCTRTAGVTGIVARYADASNYLIAYHDGTNCKLDKVVAGVTTNLISAAATYSATAVLRLVLDGTAARLFYNNAAVGAVATTPAAGSLNHGLYTTDINATFDNFIVWARGTSGEYSGLDTL